MICVDSSIWIEYFKGKQSKQTDWLDQALGVEQLMIGDLILTEVFQGFQNDSDFKHAKKRLLYFPVMEMLGEKLGIESTENVRYLRKNGITVRKTKEKETLTKSEFADVDMPTKATK